MINKEEFKKERIEILSRYRASTVKELEEKIKKGEVQEHPGWEDLIELKNIEAEIGATGEVPRVSTNH